MKLFLVILLAGVWSTTAAPQSTPNFSFQKYGLELPIFDSFDQAGEVLKCVQTAIDNVIEESELGPVWNETKFKVHQLVSVEWPKCDNHTNKFQKLKCQTTVVKNIVDVVDVLLKELATVNKWELVQAIKEKVLTFCFSEGGLIEAENEIEQFKTPVLEKFLPRFECTAKALDEVSKTLSLESLWEKSQPQLLHHLGKWKQCQKVQNSLSRYLCEAKEAATSFLIVTDYVKLADAQQPEFTPAFRNYYKQHCTGQSFDDEIAETFAVEEFAANPSYYERFECVANSLNTVSNEHGLESLWEKYQPSIEHHLDKWKNCLKSSHPVYVAICQAKEGVASFMYITKYIKLATAEDPTFMEAFADDYKENCAQHSDGDEFAELFVMDGLKACIEKLLQKFKCITGAINESINGTSLETVWAETHDKLINLQNKLSQCASSDEAVRCIYETLKESYSIFADFLKQMKEAHYETYNKIKENIKKNCYTA